MTTTLAESGLGSGKKVKRLNLLLWGPPGTWKTVIAHGLPRTRTLDLDDGMQSVEWAIRAEILNRRLDEIVYETILPTVQKKKQSVKVALEDVMDRAAEQVDEWILEEDIPPDEWKKPYPQFWDTLIIDSGTALSESSKALGLSENLRLGMTKASPSRRGKIQLEPMRMQDWGAAGALFYKLIMQWRALGKNLVLIAHEYTNLDADGLVAGFEPLLIGQLRQSLPRDFDEVWYAKIKGSKDKAHAVLQTAPDSLHRLRSRLGCLDAEEDGDFEEIKKKVAKFYGIEANSLWTAKHGSEGREEAVEEQVAEAGATI